MLALDPLSATPHSQDVLYEFRLVAVAGSYVSDPSNTANISTSGESLAGLKGGGACAIGAPSPLTLLLLPARRPRGLPFTHTAARPAASARSGWCGGRRLLPGHGCPRKHPGRLPHEQAQDCASPAQAPPPGYAFVPGTPPLSSLASYLGGKVLASMESRCTWSFLPFLSPAGKGCVPSVGRAVESLVFAGSPVLMPFQIHL